MSKIVFEKGGPLVKWLDEHIFTADHFPKDTLVCAILEDDGSVRGACAFTDYRGTCVSMHYAGAKKGWITPAFTRTCFDFVFNKLKCHRVVGMVRVDNFDALWTDLRLGFKVECLMRKADDDGADLYLLSMLREECRWLPKEK